MNYFLKVTSDLSLAHHIAKISIQNYVWHFVLLYVDMGHFVMRIIHFAMQPGCSEGNAADIFFHSLQANWGECT